jgi:hypothetical protein
VLGAPPLAAGEEGFVHFVAADDTGAATSSDWSLGRPGWSWRLDRPNVPVALLDHLDQQPKWIRSPSSKRLERASLEASLVLLEGPQAEFATRPVQATTDADLEVAYDFNEFSRLMHACLSSRREALRPACMQAAVELKRTLFGGMKKGAGLAASALNLAHEVFAAVQLLGDCSASLPARGQLLDFLHELA